MTVLWTDLGRMAYEPAWQLQHRLAEEIAERGTPDHLLFVEHERVITMGRRAREEHVLAPPEALVAAGVARYEVERGGDVTYHGPGQLVAYPILDLRRHRKDVRWYSTSLLEVLVRTLAAYGIAARAGDGLHTGVWVGKGADEAKIAALGVRVARWVTTHGVALNVAPDLADFDLIVPCGLAGTRVTSMARLLGTAPALNEVAATMRREFEEVFGVALVEASAVEVGVSA